jgi:hypothetical protein
MIRIFFSKPPLTIFLPPAWFRDDYNEVLFEYDLPSEVEKVIKDAEDRGSGS